MRIPFSALLSLSFCFGCCSLGRRWPSSSPIAEVSCVTRHTRRQAGEEGKGARAVSVCDDVSDNNSARELLAPGQKKKGAAQGRRGEGGAADAD